MLQKLAFLTLVKSSNAIFPPKSSSISSELMGGIFVSTTRYSLDGMDKVFKTQLVPLISSADKIFLFRLFQNAHIVRNPAHAHGLGPAHLSVSLTTQLMKTGFTAVLVGKIRTLVSGWIGKCPHCIRLGSVERSFTHSPEDPRILSLIGVNSPVFQCVSIDLFTEVFVLAHSRARGRPSYPVAILVIADLISKTVCFIVLDGAKMTDVCKGLQQLALRYRMPDIMIVDAGPQLRNLSDQTELLNALSLTEVKIVTVPQGHQFSSFSERMIAEAKKILNSLREDVNASMYRQPQTLLELLGKLSLVESVLSLRPILGHTKDQQQAVLTPRQLTHPFLSNEQLNANAIDILRGVFDPDETVSQLGRAGHESKVQLQNSLIDYLQETGVRYQSERAGNNQKKAYSTVKPQISDVVLFKDSEKKSRFGVIVQVCSHNQVFIRSVLNRIVTERKFHIRVLTLLFRPSEWKNDFPI
jgi:hypothetical protein